MTTLRRSTGLVLLLIALVPAACAKEADRAPRIKACTSDIRVIPGEVEGAAGHRFLRLAFNNVSRSTCRMVGYPDVDLVDDQGKVAKHVPHTLRGQAGLPDGIEKPQPVILAAGKSAVAIVEASSMPQGDGPECTELSLLVTPPGQHHVVPAGKAKLPDCGVQVHPVSAH